MEVKWSSKTVPKNKNIWAEEITLNELSFNIAETRFANYKCGEVDTCYNMGPKPQEYVVTNESVFSSVQDPDPPGSEII